MNRMKLREKLIVFFILVLLVPSVSIGWISFDTAKAKVEEKMFESAQSNLQVLDEMVTELMEATQKNVDFLASQLQAGEVGGVQGNETPQIRTMLDAFKNTHPDVELASVGTDQGVYVNSPVTAVNPPDYDPRKRPWYIRASENKNNPTIINPYISSNTGNVVASVAQTTADGHGVVSVSLSLKALEEIVQATRIGQEGYIYLLDGTGKLEGIEAVKEADRAFHSIHAEVEQLKGRLEDIAAASQEMSASTAEVVDAVYRINDVSEHNAAGSENISAATEEQVASMEEISASATSLSHLAQNLQALVERFKL